MNDQINQEVTLQPTAVDVLVDTKPEAAEGEAVTFVQTDAEVGGEAIAKETVH